MTLARQLLLDLAKEDVNKTEVTRNRAPWIAKYWPNTSYPAGHDNREPYCAAACCYWLAELGRRLAAQGQLKATTGMTSKQYEAWRCKSARAFDWMIWAHKKQLKVLAENETPEAGDFMVFDMSHIGVIRQVFSDGHLETIEANTGETGGRDGEGCYIKHRAPQLARCFIRALPPTR